MWTNNMGSFVRKSPPLFNKSSRFWLLLRGITLCTNRVERHDLTFNNTKWEEKKTQQLIRRSYLEDARIPREAAFTMQKEANAVVTEDDIIGKYNESWGGRELMY